MIRPGDSTWEIKPHPSFAKWLSGQEREDLSSPKTLATCDGWESWLWGHKVIRVGKLALHLTRAVNCVLKNICRLGKKKKKDRENPSKRNRIVKKSLVKIENTESEYCMLMCYL